MYVNEGEKVGRSNVTPTKFFSVDFFDVPSLSFKFVNDTFIAIELSEYVFEINYIQNIFFRCKTINGQ